MSDLERLDKLIVAEHKLLRRSAEEISAGFSHVAREIAQLELNDLSRIERMAFEPALLIVDRAIERHVERVLEHSGGTTDDPDGS